MTRTENVETLLSQAYRLVASCDTDAASGFFEQALQQDFDHPEVLFSLKCEAWWQDSLKKTAARTDAFDAGEYLLGQWKVFQSYLSSQAETFERPCLAFKQLAFGKALGLYSTFLQDGDTCDPEISHRIGCCYKGLGDYDNALKHVEEATRIAKDDPCYLAELADIYELINEPRAAKALFREAFFLNPQRIDLELLESATIARLRDKAIENGRIGHETAEWIPVYGEISGVFSVKRELKAIEVSKLKNTLYELEAELHNDGSRRSVLVPRLINKYFWLADHFLSVKEDKSRIDELLLKIKLLDATVYKMYIA